MKKVFALIGLLMTSSAMAEGGYVGLGVGQAKVKDVEVINFGPGITTTVDDTDTSFRIFAGYKFHPNFAGEIAYERIGEMSVKYDDGVDYITTTAEATAITISALGLIPVNESVSVFGRFGFAMAEVDAKLTSSFLPSDSVSGSSNNPVFGLGIQYDLPTVLIRAEFNRYTDVGDNDTGESDVDVFGFSAGMKF